MIRFCLQPNVRKSMNVILSMFRTSGSARTGSVILRLALGFGGLLMPIAGRVPTARAIEKEVESLSAFTTSPVGMPFAASNQPTVPDNCSQITALEFQRFRRGQGFHPSQVSAAQLCFDWLQVRNSQLYNRDRALLERRLHILRWLKSLYWADFSGSAAVHIEKQDDPEGYAQLKSFWLTATQKEQVLLHILQNAEVFFERDDKPLAEQLLMRMRSAGGLATQRMGRMYAMSLADVHDIEELPTQRNWDLVSVQELRPNALTVARTPFARTVLRRMENSVDDRLLAHTGLYLMELSRLNQRSELWKLGVEYAKRAARLNPDSRESRGFTR